MLHERDLRNIYQKYLPNDNFLDRSKLKVYADDKINVTLK